MTICPECGAVGKGPRFSRRHPALCKQRKENTEWSRNLAARTRAVLNEEDRQLLLMALAMLAIRRPGFEYALSEIARRIDRIDNERPQMYDRFRELLHDRAARD